MTAPAEPDPDFDLLVADLAVRHRSRKALGRLIAAGPRATPAVRRGLRHAEPAVRVGCCRVLDHVMHEDALPELIENLGHANASVRTWAVHALACERCKEGACRPAEATVMPLAIALMKRDPSYHVRMMAAGLLGHAVHRRADVLDALVTVAKCDSHPAVRKVARWFVPGGPRYERSKPVQPRRGARR